MSVWSKIEALKEQPGWSDRAIGKALGKDSHSWLSNVRVGYAGMKAKDAEALVQILVDNGLIADDSERKNAILELLSIRPATDPFPAIGVGS